MKTRTGSSTGEQVLVRHITAAKRKDIRGLEPSLKTPFRSEPVGSCCYDDSGATPILGFTTGRCLIAAQFAGDRWVALYSNAASAEELFKANASGPKLEVAWVGCRTDVGWFFRLNRGGKPVVEFAQAQGADSPSTCKLAGIKLKKGESGEQAVKRLCKHFEISRPMPVVHMSKKGFTVVDADGRELKSGLRGYLRIEGPGAPKKHSASARALAEAIGACDADGIRAAVAQGASLTDEVPDVSMPPLLKAAYRLDAPGGLKCVELLAKLGCPVDGDENGPPLVVCAGDDTDPSVALKAVKLLVAHGADVNAADRFGITALYQSVLEGHLQLARFLLEHGADPAIKNRMGMSAVDWARKRYEEETGFKARTLYAELLSLLTGQPVAKPEAQRLRPELRAENERFKFMRARRLRGITPQQAGSVEVPALLINGSLPRYERVGFYLDFSGHDDPWYSTEKEARYWSEMFAEARREPPGSIGDALDAAVRLALMRHFQFAGAPAVHDVIVKGSDLALPYFQACARPSKGRVEYAWLQMRGLLDGLLLCALAGRWQIFKQVCNAVRPGLASADKAQEYGEADLDYAQVLLLFVSGYRDRALPKIAALEQALAKRIARRPRLLLEVQRALDASRPADLTEALRQSLEYFVEMRGDERFVSPGKVNNPFRFAAVPESVFYLAAVERGLKLAPMPEHVADLLVTPKTIG
jgi:hypothetical protein